LGQVIAAPRQRIEITCQLVIDDSMKGAMKPMTGPPVRGISKFSPRNMVANESRNVEIVDVKTLRKRKAFSVRLFFIPQHSAMLRVSRLLVVQPPAALST
jgi:hypothetical protein